MILQPNIVLVKSTYIFILLEIGCFVGHILPVYGTCLVSRSRETVQLSLCYWSQILLRINLTPFF